MSDDENFDSDSSDDDYVPEVGEKVSEEEDSGDDEALILGTSGTQEENITQGKRRTPKTTSFTRKRQGGIKIEDEESKGEDKEDDEHKKKLEEEIKKETERKKEEQEKKKSDDLWSSFMSDMPSKPKPRPASQSGLGSLSSVIKPSTASSPKTIVSTLGDTNGIEKKPETTENKKITITKEFDFAGEIVKITKEVAADSKEAKAELKKQDEPKPEKAGPSLTGLKRPAKGGGLGNLLDKIGKKPKISTLEKSKLDWESFKSKEGIDEELKIHNRGKSGFIERQQFLQRTDVRQFEIEKSLRMNTSKR